MQTDVNVPSLKLGTGYLKVCCIFMMEYNTAVLYKGRELPLFSTHVTESNR